MWVEPGDNDFEQGTVDQCSNNKAEKLRVVAQAYNPSIFEGDTGRYLGIWYNLDSIMSSRSALYTERACVKNKAKIMLWKMPGIRHPLLCVCVGGGVLTDQCASRIATDTFTESWTLLLPSGYY